jgi:hypothetical protein
MTRPSFVLRSNHPSRVACKGSQLLHVRNFLLEFDSATIVLVSRLFATSCFQARPWTVLCAELLEASLVFLRHRRKIQVPDFPSSMGKPQIAPMRPLSLLTRKADRIYEYRWKFLRLAGLQSPLSATPFIFFPLVVDRALGCEAGRSSLLHPQAV